jgi:hypothetical protein
MQKWDFSKIAQIDTALAQELQSCPDSQEIASAVISKFQQAFESNQLQIGWERSSLDCSHHRVVVQFQVGATIYNQFFNGLSGYRGQFYFSETNGLRFNAVLISKIRNYLLRHMTSVVVPFEIGAKFISVIGKVVVSKEQIFSSLNPTMAKAWRADCLITNSAKLEPVELVGIGPKIGLPGNQEWDSLIRSEDDSWLEIKGAFLSNSLLYQIKTPWERAATLHARGTA